MNISRRSFLKATTATAAVIAVPKLAESVEVEPVLKSCSDGISKSLFSGHKPPYTDGAVYCEIDGQWEYAGEVIDCSYNGNQTGTIDFFAERMGILSGRYMINGKIVSGNTDGYLSKPERRIHLAKFPPDLYQSLNAPYPIMLESV